MRLRGLDFFPKVNQDIDRGSTFGGIFTVLAFIIGLFLFIRELQGYLVPSLVKHIDIQYDPDKTYIQANIDINFMNAPCLGIALDQQDEIGVHKTDIHENIKKIRLDKNANIIPEYFGVGKQNYQYSQEEKRDLVQAIMNGEGCKFVGFFNINRVPGNFHVSYHSRRDLFQYLMINESASFAKLNLNFQIIHLSFGEDKNIGYVSKIFKQFNAAEFSPYEGLKVVAEQKKEFDYYIKIVPNIFLDKVHNQKYDNMFHYSILGKDNTIDQYQGLPALFFRYEIAPITMVYTLQSTNFLSFLVQICAIIGGAVSLLGMINAYTSNILEFFSKK